VSAAIVWSQSAVASETCAPLISPNEPRAHPGGRAGVDLVEQRRAEEVGAVHRGHEAVVRGVEGTLVVVVGVFQTDLRHGSDANVVDSVRHP
jgi:hypothetical protein